MMWVSRSLLVSFIYILCFFFKQKTAYEMRISDWGSDVCSSDLADIRHVMRGVVRRGLKPQSPKAAISLRVEQDVLEWFKAQGPGYQTRINAEIGRAHV